MPELLKNCLDVAHWVWENVFVKSKSKIKIIGLESINNFIIHNRKTLKLKINFLTEK